MLKSALPFFLLIIVLTTEGQPLDAKFSGIKSFKPVLLWKVNTTFTRSPVYDSKNNQLYLIDLEHSQLLHLNWKTGMRYSYQAPPNLTTVSLYENEEVLVTLPGGLHVFSHRLKTLKRIGDGRSYTTDEDFVVLISDNRGRLFASSLSDNLTSRLYQKEVDRKWLVNKDLIAISDICWSQDNRYIYVSDAVARTIYRGKFDLETGAVGHLEKFLHLKPGQGEPRGMAVNKDGNLWVAHGTAGRVVLWDIIKRKPKRKVKIDAPIVTDIAFVGTQLQYMVATTALIPISGYERTAEPQAGSVYLWKVKVAGLQTYRSNFGKTFVQSKFMEVPMQF